MLKLRRSRNLSMLFLKIVITSFCFCIIIITAWFSRTSYTSLISFVTQQLNRPDLKPLIVNSLFTLEKYELLFNYHWLSYPIIIIISSWLLFKIKWIYNNILLVFLLINRTFFHFYFLLKNLFTWQKLILTVVVGSYIAVILSNQTIKPISYDEAWSYNYYINKPFYFPLILFNTYPLFNIICHFFTFLPFNAITNIRLPSLVFSALTISVFFYSLHKKFGYFLALIGVLMLGASPLFYIYSTLSRGITLALFFSVIVFHVTYEINKGNTFYKRYYILFIVTNMLGIASMPTFIVLTISSIFYLICYKYKQKEFLVTLIKSFLLIVAGSFILYFPVLLSLGTDLFKHNEHYLINFHSIINKLMDVLLNLSKLFFISEYILIIVIPLSILLLLVPQLPAQKKLLRYSIFVVAFTLIARAATGNILPERAISFLIFSFIVILVILVSWLFKLYTNRVKISFLVLFSMVFSLAILHNQKKLFSPPEDADAEIIGELLLQNNVRTVYINEEDFWYRVPMIEFYYAEKNQQITIETSAKSSTRHRDFNPNNNYDCIINKSSYSNIDTPYKEVYRNKQFVVKVKPRSI